MNPIISISRQGAHVMYVSVIQSTCLVCLQSSPYLESTSLSFVIMREQAAKSVEGLDE